MDLKIHEDKLETGDVEEALEDPLLTVEIKNDERKDDSTSILSTTEDLPTEMTNELSDEERMELFHKGVEFKGLGSHKHALLCFLGCLRDMRPSSAFSAMPLCLKNIADIYAEHEDYEKAVQFIQAAKLYYETAIVSLGQQSQTSEEELSINKEYKTLDEDAKSDVALRANEYEKLSNSCLKEKNLQLALEYCGKATQLRRELYGDSHPITVKSLDLFTVIYSEIGKKQYSDAVDKFHSRNADAKSPLPPSDKKEGLQQTVITSCLKGRKESKSKSVRFTGIKPSKEGRDLNASYLGGSDSAHARSSTKIYEDESIGHVPLSQVVLFILISILIAVFLTYAWCYYSQSPRCPSYQYLRNLSMYFYYSYIQPWFSDDRYI